MLSFSPSHRAFLLNWNNTPIGSLWIARSFMKEIFKLLKKDKITKWSAIISGILLVSEFIYIGVFYLSLPAFVPLFNQLPWGEERLGLRIDIFIPTIIILLFFLTNFILISKLYEKMPLVSRMLGITTLLITVLSFIFTLQTLHIIL